MTDSTVSTFAATLENDLLTIGNAHIERQWRVQAGRLYAISLLDKRTHREWITQPATLASLVSDTPLQQASCELTTQISRDHQIEAESLKADLTLHAGGQTIRYRFKLYEDLAAIGMQLIVDTHERSSVESHVTETAAPTGVETDGSASANQINPSDIIDAFHFDHQHCWLLQTRFVEQTDIHNNLVFENRWSLGTSEKKIELQGNLFYIEHRPTAAGLVLLKEAPTPQFRPVTCDTDLDLRLDHLILRGHGLDETGGEGYRQWTILYHGDRPQRIAAVQALQQRIRPYVSGRDGVLLSNTWGDRSRDACISEAFLIQEIEAGAEMGVDVTQIDDGWQKGLTANSAVRGGVWNGFWASDANFWDPHQIRFPNGLAPLMDRLKLHNMQLGLWYAPDSSDDSTNYLRDAEQIVTLNKKFGVNHVKIDAVKMHTKIAEQRLHQFYQTVLQKTEGQVTFDSDVTAEVRPGYWGQMYVGTIFVENRYTDWHNHWPHQTLRNLWRLSHHIHPMRLRMEFLNPYRSTNLYAHDPLAPANYSPAALFAMVMMSSPLAWFEVSNTTPEFRQQIGDLVRVWKQYRQTIFTSAIIPIGDEPDGYSWCGFVTYCTQGDLFAVVYRPLGDAMSFDFALPRRGAKCVDLLHGQAEVSLQQNHVKVTIPASLGYAFFKISY